MEARSEGEGVDIVCWVMGEVVKDGGYSGVRLTGLRRVFSGSADGRGSLDGGVPVVGVEVGAWFFWRGIPAFTAMCVVPVLAARDFHRGWRAGDGAACVDRRVVQGGDVKAFGGRRSSGL